MTDTEKLIWNRAIEAAVNAVVQAPVFPREADGPATDGERIRVLDIAQKQVRALAR